MDINNTGEERRGDCFYQTDPEILMLLRLLHIILHSNLSIVRYKHQQKYFDLKKHCTDRHIFTDWLQQYTDIKLKQI